MTASRFRVGTAGTELLEPPEQLREGFARTRALECPGALDPALLALLMRHLEGASFEPNHVKKLGDREVEAGTRAGTALRFALKRRNLFDWLARATGCGPLDDIVGSVVQARAGQDHQLDWHDDRRQPRRRLAVTINLSTAPYEGGLFEMRRTETREPLLAYHHAEPGTALIFDVASDIEHRTLPVTAGGPRRVFTGWFLKPEA